MATPVVPSQFAVSKNKIVHKPTKATFSFDTGHTTFRALIGGMWVSNYQLAQITGKTM
jgi:hypothetical protein